MEKTNKNKSNKICSVPECRTRCNKQNNIALHQFPNDKLLKKSWLHVTRINKKSITKNDYVCSKHFEDTDYKNPENKHYLKKTAVPSKNVPPSKFTKPLAKQRSQRLQEPVMAESQNLRESRELSIEHNPEAPEFIDVGDLENQTADAAVQVSIVLDSVIARDIERNSKLTIDDLITSASQLNIMTSLRDTKTIGLIENSIMDLCLEPDIYNRVFKTNFSVKLKILLVLIKLKQNFNFSVLSVLFGISVPTSLKYFREMLPVMRAGLKPLIYWPSKEEIQTNIPDGFSDFADVRAVLDCIEVEVSQANPVKCKEVTNSHRKERGTVKFLVAFSPGGLITYVSRGYTAKDIFNQQNLINLFSHNDAVMVDKDFVIDENELKMKNIKLYRPSFKDSKTPFVRGESIDNTAIAAARVHVESSIRRIKSYKILNNRVDHCLSAVVDDIFNIICCLVNISSPKFNENKF